MKFRRIVVRALSVGAVIAAALVGTAGVSAAEPLPNLRMTYFGDEIWTLGDHAFCAGSINVGLETDRTKPGHTTTAVLTPRGMRGNGPEWTANPICKLDVQIRWMDGVAPFSHLMTVPMSIGEGPQAPVRVDLPTGSGLAQLDFRTSFLSYPVSYYAIVP